MRYTGKCVCGTTLEEAYSSELDAVFMNCFTCFPFYEKRGGQQ